MRSFVIFLGLVALFVSTPVAPRAHAADGSVRLVFVCYLAGPMTPSRAEPALEALLDRLEDLGGWPDHTFEVDLATELAACRSAMRDRRPPYAILSLGEYLAHRRAHHLLPLAAPRIEGSLETHVMIVARREGPSTLEDLLGQRIAGPLLDEREFIDRLVFEGRHAVERDFQIVPGRRVLRALRNLARGRLEGVFIDDVQHRSLSALPFAADLEVIYRSAPLPLIGLTADGSATSAEERRRMVAALTRLCTGDEGKRLCEAFGVEAFVPRREEDYRRVIELWEAR